MKAVVWTDVFQAMVMFGGMLAMVVQVSDKSRNLCILPPLKGSVNQLTKILSVYDK